MWCSGEVMGNAVMGNTVTHLSHHFSNIIFFCSAFLLFDIAALD